MPDFILLMHDDGASDANPLDWQPYLDKLRVAGTFGGGSAIGPGTCMRRAGPVPGVSTHIVGFITLTARDLDAACGLLTGNPVYERDGTVEVRELPHSS